MAFGELIRRSSGPPERSPLKIITKAKPKQAPGSSEPTSLPTPSSDFRRRADELRRRVVARDPSLAQPPGAPKRTPLVSIKPKPQISVKPKEPPRSPLNINIRPKPQYEWTRWHRYLPTSYRSCA